MKVDWYKCQGGVYCDLFKVDLTHKYLDGLVGVYILWYGATTPQVLKVGSGIIKNELTKAKNDLALRAFAAKGVYVTWAQVSKLKCSSYELFLIEQCDPKLPCSIPKAVPMKINLPWETVYDEDDE